MAFPSDDRLHDDEMAAQFARLFPNGWAGDDVLAELAPQGWPNSPLVAAYHPSLEQVYHESLQFHRNLKSLPWAKNSHVEDSEPSFEDVAANYKTTPVDVIREVRELVGKCLWDVFSDNHEVLTADGRQLDTGSFRASGAFLAELLNEQVGNYEYDYMDFYMGSSWVAGRADLSPIYRMIFRRMKAIGLDWVYHFPRLLLVDFRPLKAAMDEAAADAEQQPDWEGYDPASALEKAEDDRRRDEEISEMRASLDEAHREAVEEAQQMPPPAIVQAYQEIYGMLPEGWPPSV